MVFFRPLSVLALRIPNFFSWTIDTNSLAQPLLQSQTQEIQVRQKEATESLAQLSLTIQQKVLKTYSPPAYLPPKEVSKIERLKGNF
jgi:hypothetical protein